MRTLRDDAWGMRSDRGSATLVLVTQGGSGPLCLAAEGGQIYKGTTDPASAAGCTGAP